MKKIYIVLSHSGSLLSKTIRFVKKYTYTHVSISLDKQLNEMYSFGRIYPYNAFLGGFVKESPKYGTFKRFYKTTSKIYYIEITDEQYKKIKKLIKYFKRKKKDYKFNLLGLFSVALHIKLTREKGFYCAEFIKYLLDKSNIKNNLPELVTPEDFKKLQDIHPVYIGKLADYVE